MNEKEPVIGRPTIYSPELVTLICTRLAEGESLRSICRDDDMPVIGTVMRWLTEDDKQSFREQYVRARECQAESMAEEILEISDDATNDWMEKHRGGNVGYELNGEHVQRSRLRVDARKWLASKMAPKKYGERIMAEHTGKDGGPIETKTDSDIARRIAYLLAKASPNNQ